MCVFSGAEGNMQVRVYVCVRVLVSAPMYMRVLQHLYLHRVDHVRLDCLEKSGVLIVHQLHERWLRKHDAKRRANLCLDKTPLNIGGVQQQYPFCVSLIHITHFKMMVCCMKKRC